MTIGNKAMHLKAVSTDWPEEALSQERDHCYYRSRNLHRGFGHAAHQIRQGLGLWPRNQTFQSPGLRLLLMPLPAWPKGLAISRSSASSQEENGMARDPATGAGSRAEACLLQPAMSYLLTPADEHNRHWGAKGCRRPPLMPLYSLSRVPQATQQLPLRSSSEQHLVKCIRKAFLHVFLL